MKKIIIISFVLQFFLTFSVFATQLYPPFGYDDSFERSIVESDSHYDPDTSKILYMTPVYTDYLSQFKGFRALSYGYFGNCGYWNSYLVCDSSPCDNYVIYIFYEANRSDCIDLKYNNFTTTPPLLDNDNDGIPDNYDLAPNSPDNPKWKMISQTKNIATGEIVSALIQTDFGEYIRFGEKPEDMTGFQDYLSIGSQFKDNSELQETLEAGSYQGSTYSVQTSEQVMSELNSSSLAVNNASIPDVPDDFQNQGETVSDTSQTDTTTLQSTQNNTAQIVTNTAQTGAYLKAINDNLKTLNTLTATGAGQVSQGLSKNDIKSGVKDALNDDSVDVPDNSSVSDALTVAQDTIKGDASLADDAPDEYKTKTDIVAKMADYISNNPLTNIITGSQIQCSGAVSHIESNLYGHSISFDLAPYSSQLQVFGQMLLAITTLAGMLLIFRK